ncbi:MAG TPA: hypothetical protein VMV19_18245 [Xanthobacteraceae bacterium]|nr:hypothetical protein [Xanthobacteraceae bacterium]
MRTKYQTELTAFHEAGHAVAHAVLDLPFEHVTIVPADDSDGHVAYDRPHAIVEAWNNGDRDSAEVRHHSERELITLLAGLEAQRRRFPRSHKRMTYSNRSVYGDDFDGDGNPVPRSTRIAASGADYTTAGRIVDDLFGNRAIALDYLVYINTRTRVLIWDHWEAIERVAHALIERRTLTYDDVLRVVYPLPFPVDLSV